MDGVLVVDKPAGPTSHDVVDLARRALGERRIGHTGTLDPFATGVLALCVGKATRLARFLSAGEKEYLASVRLGFATTTDDGTGEAIGAPRPVDVSSRTLAEALGRLVGEYDQVPPSFSARHAGGRRLYELARRGETVPRAAARVTVHAIELTAFAGDQVDVVVRCSPGTYVRALARDLGDALGTGGHLTALRRTRSGEFDLARAVDGGALASEQAGERARQALVPMRELLTGMPAAVLPPGSVSLVRNGRPLSASDVASGFPCAPVERLRLLDEDGNLVALAVAVGVEAATGELPRFPQLHADVVLAD